MSHIDVKLRCSLIVFHKDNVLLVYRREQADWVLPGGTPRPGEDMVTCVHRELREETGMLVDPGECALIAETAQSQGERLLDLIFLSPTKLPAGHPRFTEQGLGPEFISLDQIDSLTLHPPVARHLKSLYQHPRPVAPQHIWHDRSQTF